MAFRRMTGRWSLLNRPSYIPQRPIQPRNWTEQNQIEKLIRLLVISFTLKLWLRNSPWHNIRPDITFIAAWHSPRHNVHCGMTFRPEMTFTAAWHSPDMIFALVWHSPWHDIRPDMTFTLTWHSPCYDIYPEMTFTLTWHSPLHGIRPEWRLPWLRDLLNIKCLEWMNESINHWHEKYISRFDVVWLNLPWLVDTVTAR